MEKRIVSGKRMMIWDMNFKITTKGCVDIVTPPFYLNANETANPMWIRIVAPCNETIEIFSNLLSRKDIIRYALHI